MSHAITGRRCFSKGCGLPLRSDLTPSLIRRKLTCDTGTRRVVTSLHGQLLNPCELRLRLQEIETWATA